MQVAKKRGRQTHRERLRYPLTVTMNISPRISAYRRVCCAALCPTQSVGANDDCRIVVYDYVLVGQGLGFCWIDIARGRDAP